MCGITGIWRFDGLNVATEIIDRFTDSLEHRGPDGRGVWIDNSTNIALGHRRLSILDLSEQGKQPMHYLERYVITYNGEIYNFLEIREELKAKGYVFHSDSDTEVILASYAEWGAKMQLKFNGMWAFAIFDKVNKEFFISRDRFGIKPFHYILNEKYFAFASELKSFKKLEYYKPELDKESAFVYMQNGFGLEGTQRTLLKNVKRLQGGHCALLKQGKMEITRYWNTLEHLETPPENEEKQAERFYELFRDAVKIRMRSDVSIGSCLSGGFDSTSVVCTLSEIGKEHNDLRQSENWQKTFVATFPGAYNDEEKEARLAVDYAKVEGNFFSIDDSFAVKDIEKILQDFDDAYIGLPTPVWYVYKELRKNNVVVSLDGHGADELMGAYKPLEYLFFQEAPSFFRYPFQNLKIIFEYWKTVPPLLKPKGLLKKVGKTAGIYLKFHPFFKSDSGKVKRILKRLFQFVSSFETKFKEPEAGFLRQGMEFDRNEFIQLGSNDKLPEAWKDINRDLYGMFHSHILPSILRNYDRMSMAHGIEVRMPFMDYRLVQYVFSLPDESKIANGYTKLVARNAMKGKIPEYIRTNKLKIGFNSPMPEWFNGPLIPWIKDILNDSKFKHHDIINMEKVTEYFSFHFENKSWTWYNVGQAWHVLHLLWFEREFINE